MLDVFNARIQSTHSDLLEDTELEFGRNMLKTAIIESNIQFEEILDLDQVEESIEIGSNLSMVRVQPSETDGWLFFDTVDERFWVVYSMEKSKFFNKSIDRMLDREGGGLDRLWLPTGQVEEIGDMGVYEGIKISFGADDVFPEEFIEDNLEFVGLNIDGSGKSAKKLYDSLRTAEDIDEFLALSRVQIRREVEDEFVRERVTNEGAFTTRAGSDIRLHLSTVEQIKERYASLLEDIESNHIIGAESRENSSRPSGGPVVIKFSKPVPDVGQFLEYVVNARDPFRLWGHTKEVGDQAYKIDGVDAHNGDKIAIEMSPQWLRLYLYDGACGNTALRLFTNIQQYYDPAAELVIKDV